MMQVSQEGISFGENKRPEQIFSSLLQNMTKKNNNMEHQIHKLNISIQNLKVSIQNNKIDRRNLIERVMQVSYDLMNSPDNLWYAYKEVLFKFF
jgi:hypothetical protein